MYILLNFVNLFMNCSWDTRDNKNETFYFIFACIGLEATFEVGPGPLDLGSGAHIGHYG